MTATRFKGHRFGIGLAIAAVCGCGGGSAAGGGGNGTTIEAGGQGGTSAVAGSHGGTVGGYGGSSGGNSASAGNAGSSSGGTGGNAQSGGSSALGGSNTGGSNTGGSSANAGTSGASAGASGSAGSGGAVTRPSYNTGTGFFTVNGKLYDANGQEFHMMGVDTVHYDENWASCTSNCGIPNSHANVNRMGVPLWSAIPSATIQNLMNRMIAAHIVPVAGVWYVDGSYADASNVTCQEDSGAGSAFSTAVSEWVAREPLFKPFEKYMLLNIANEWGPSDKVGWRDAYTAAVAKLREAGYLCTLVIDAGGCGQDVNDIVKYAQAIYDSDPQHNIVFDQHVYGLWASKATGEASWQTDLTTGLDQLKATGLPILIGEFGPGKNIGPSPTPLTPASIIQAATARGFGWLAWAWDDGYGTGNSSFVLSNQGFFSLTNGAPTNGGYPNNTDLSAFGNEVVLNPTFGTFKNARPSGIF